MKQRCGAEAECFVKCICQFRACIGGLIAFPFIFQEIHLLQCVDDLADGVPVVQLPFQVPVDDEGDEACDEMRNDAVLELEVYRSCLELTLHDTEALLDLPSALVHLYDGFRPVLQARAYGIEAVILLLLCDGILVNVTEETKNLNFYILCLEIQRPLLYNKE